MHPKDEVIRALIDQQLTAVQAQQTRQHLDSCPTCQSRFAQMQGAAGSVQNAMRWMEPRQREQPPAPRLAYNRLSTTKKEPIFMFNRRPIWTALAVIVMLALVFTLTPASAWASSFLGLFRVQRITVVQFDPNAASDSRNALEQNQEMIKQVLQDNLEISEGGEAQEVDSVDAATAAAGFTPRLPAALSNPQLAVQPGMTAVLTIEREKMQALLDAAGVDFALPASVDGEKVTVTAENTVLAGYGCQPAARDTAPEADCTVLVQLPSPTIDAPEALNVQRMGEAMLRFLGLSEAEARAVSQRIDWTTTLVLPIPQGENISYQDVTVDGVTGTLVMDPDTNSYILLWVKDGMLYSLKGSGGAEDVLYIAGTMQ